MSLIYVIIDKEDRIPILTATSLKKAEELLNEYMGISPKYPDCKAEYVGFKAYDSEHPDIFEGVYTYKAEWGIQEFIRYCMVVDDLI
jgi:hypothetical protein